MTARTQPIRGVNGDMTLSLADRERTIPCMLEQAASAYGDKRLVTLGEASWTYAETRSVAARAAWKLQHEFGLQHGDTVCLMLRNRIEFLELLLGAAWLGVISAPLNVAAKGEQLQHMLANSDARVVVCEADLVSRVEDAAGSAALRLVTVGEREDSSTSPKREHWILGERGGELPAADVAPSDPFAILYTSGTTGVSKGVLCPHAQYYWWAEHNIDLLELVSDDILLTTLPMFHTNALSALWQAVRAGASIVYEARFSASGFKSSILRSGATVTFLLGAMVPILLTTREAADDALTTLDRVLSPGVPEDVLRSFSRRFGVRVIDGFASTESNFVIGSRAGERRSGWMGTVRPGFEARVANEYDAEVPDGTPGELLLRANSPYAFSLGYHKMPDATLDAWRNLWVHTGDRVIRDASGYYKFVDRLKDVIRRRGENISSFEVENALLTHPALESAAVIPVASELAEDEVMAVVIAKPNVSISPAELLDHVQQQLAYFAVPRYIEFVSEFPLTENGKVKKFQLRERGVTERTWDREAAGYQLQRDR